MVTGDEIHILGPVVESKGENTVQLFQKVGALVLVEGKNYLAVTLGLKLIGICIAPADLLMIVDLPVHGQNDIPILAVQRLTS